VSGRCEELPDPDPGAAARLTALYEAHAADAFRYALHLTGRREDAEDVVQYVFLRAYGMLESGTALVNPRAWLIKATKHRSLNLIRDRRETPTIDADIAVAPRHDEDAAETEALAEVRSTLWALPENQHHAFVLRHWSGLSQDEIADVLGTTAGAVESLLVRARTTLLADREHQSECASVRTRLVQALVPTPDHRAHIASCRRCRTAQTRLLRASEFATAFTLVPRPYVAHALASAIPGFGGHVAAAAGTAGGGAAGAGGAGGAGTGIATASAATKLAVASKVALVTATAVVALGAAHPIRRAVEHAVLGTPRTATAAAAPSAGRSHPQPASAHHAGATAPAKPPAHPAPKTPSKGSKTNGKSAHAGGNGNGKAKGKGNGNGKTSGAPAAPGATKGKSATAGSNGKATGKPAGAGKPAKNGAANGKSATAGSNGKAKGKQAAAGSTGNGAAKGHGKG
jgi:RNA polymerase sigma factor (sigma-70 family)